MNKQKLCFAECYNRGNTDLVSIQPLWLLQCHFPAVYNIVEVNICYLYIYYILPASLHWLSEERGADIQHLSASARLCGCVQNSGDSGNRRPTGGQTESGAMAADGGCGESVDQYRAELERLTQELAEANREKIRAAECGLVVLEENQALKQKYGDLENEQETLRKELEQLQEVGEPGSAAVLGFFFFYTTVEPNALQSGVCGQQLHRPNRVHLRPI